MTGPSSAPRRRSRATDFSLVDVGLEHDPLDVGVGEEVGGEELHQLRRTTGAGRVVGEEEVDAEVALPAVVVLADLVDERVVGLHDPDRSIPEQDQLGGEVVLLVDPAVDLGDLLDRPGAHPPEARRGAR